MITSSIILNRSAATAGRPGMATQVPSKSQIANCRSHAGTNRWAIPFQRGILGRQCAALTVSRWAMLCAKAAKDECVESNWKQVID